VLQGVAGLQRVAMCCHVCAPLEGNLTRDLLVDQTGPTCCSVLQGVAMCCSVCVPSEGYGMALDSRIDKSIGLFCKRAL